jgi:hypothetical protein
MAGALSLCLNDLRGSDPAACPYAGQTPQSALAGRERRLWFRRSTEELQSRLAHNGVPLKLPKDARANFSCRASAP